MFFDVPRFRRGEERDAASLSVGLWRGERPAYCDDCCVGGQIDLA
jgi:hypothetical protein